MSRATASSSATVGSSAPPSTQESSTFVSPRPAGTLRLLLHLVRLTLAGHGRVVARKLGIGVPARIELADLAAPETRLAHDATEWAEEVCPRLLLDHGRRGFLFADAIARHQGQRPDREALYLGCLLHDLGLAPRFDRGNEFERDGADAAVERLAAQGLSGARLRLVREIIELHDAVHQAHHASIETRLAHFGIGVDVLGLRREDLHPDTLAAIVAAWPRGSFRTDFPEILRDQLARKPQSHIARLVRLGLAERVRAAPIPDGPS